MRTFHFDVARHEEYGTLGLRPRWYPNGDPLGGMTAAHDILEHFPRDDGGTEGELMALGAALHVRSDGGWRNRYRRFDETRDIPADFPELWRLHNSRANSRPLGQGHHPRNLELLDRIRALMNHVKKRMREEGDSEWVLPTKQDYIAMGNWLAHGYTRAQRRYRHVIGGICSVSDTFMRIENEAERCLKHAEVDMVFTVRLNIKRSDLQMSCDYPEHPLD